MTSKRNISIDLNSDLGEHPGTDLDEQIMPFLSSCNIACGGHIGDEASVRQTIRLAKKHDVAIGAHPSYPDKENFGRKIIAISETDLKKSLSIQIGLVKQICEEESVLLHHVKPHGALYNLAAKNKQASQLISEIIRSINPLLKLYGLAGSITEEIALENELHFIGEAFADRRYLPDGTLMPRSRKEAVLTKETEVLRQAEEIAFNQRIMADNWIRVKAKTICLHSDTKGAILLAQRIKDHLVSKRAHITAV